LNSSAVSEPFADWLHEDYLKLVPIHKFNDDVVRLRLCSVYPSVWRRHLRSVLQQAVESLQQQRQQQQRQRQRSEEISNVNKLVVSTMNSLLPEEDSGEGWRVYLDCPALHLIAMHELQCWYVSSCGSPAGMFLSSLMTCLRKSLQESLELFSSFPSSSSSSSSSSTARALDAYIPNGVWLSDVTSILHRSTISVGASSSSSSSSNALLGSLSSAVKSIETAVVSTSKQTEHESDREARENRNAVWLYLLQWGEHVDAARREVSVSLSQHHAGAQAFLSHADNNANDRTL
jgi:hypothetical protein